MFHFECVSGSPAKCSHWPLATGMLISAVARAPSALDSAATCAPVPVSLCACVATQQQQQHQRVLES